MTLYELGLLCFFPYRLIIMSFWQQFSHTLNLSLISDSNVLTMLMELIDQSKRLDLD